jgi:hypothetical protein
MPDFWDAAECHHVDRLCDVVLLLIDDPRMENAGQFDCHGVDCLAASVLGGLTNQSKLRFLEGGKLDNLIKQLWYVHPAYLRVAGLPAIVLFSLARANFRKHSLSPPSELQN